MAFANSVPNIGPERDAKLSTSLLQTQKRVATATAKLASSSCADVSLLRVFADVIFRQVVVQRNFRAIENHEQMLSLGVNRL